MRKRALVVLFVASCAVVSGAFACGGAQAPSSTSSGTASETIGTSGGTVSTTSGASITFGTGDVTKDTTITIAESSSSPIPAHVTAVGTPYVFGPEGSQFAHPVFLTLPFTAKSIPSGKTSADITIFTAPVGSNDFTELATTLADSSHVTASTTHFSVFVPCIVDDTDAGANACVDDSECVRGATCEDNMCVLGDAGDGFDANEPPQDASFGCAADDECPSGEVCRAEACVPGSTTTSDAGVDAASTCIQDTDCPDGQVCIDDTCQALSSGDAGGDGGAGDATVDSAAGDAASDADAQVCPAGQTSCSERCTDLTSDPANCGACSEVCQTGETCSEGVCSG